MTVSGSFKYSHNSVTASKTSDEPVSMTFLAGTPMSAFAHAQPRSRSLIICISSITQISTSTVLFIISMVELIWVDSSSIISSSPVMSETPTPFAFRFS